MNLSGNVFRSARVGGNMRIGSQERELDISGGGNRETFPFTGRINLDAAAAEDIDR